MTLFRCFTSSLSLFVHALADALGLSSGFGSYVECEFYQHVASVIVHCHQRRNERTQWSTESLDRNHIGTFNDQGNRIATTQPNTNITIILIAAINRIPPLKPSIQTSLCANHSVEHGFCFKNQRSVFFFVSFVTSLSFRKLARLVWVFFSRIVGYNFGMRASTIAKWNCATMEINGRVNKIVARNHFCLVAKLPSFATGLVSIQMKNDEFLFLLLFCDNR